MRLWLQTLLREAPLPAGPVARDERWLWLMSVAVGLALLVFVPITYFGDSDSYLRLARWMVSGSTEYPTTYRTPGYSLLLLATGVVHGDTFLWLMLAQSAMGVTIPILIYRIVALYDNRVAYYTAVFSIMSLVPYGSMKSVLTEEFYVFVLLLIVYLVARLVATRRPVYAYAAAAAFFALLLIRPVANYLSIICFASLALSLRSSKKLVMHLGLSFLLLVVLLQAYVQVWNRAVMGPKRVVSAYNVAGWAGTALFYNVYLTGGHLNNDVVRSGGSLDNSPAYVRETAGPAQQELGRVLRSQMTREYLVSTRVLQGPDFVYAYFYQPYLDDPQRLVDEMLAAPSLSYYFYMWQVVYDALGPVQADKLFTRVSLELLRQRPLIGIKYITRNIYFFGAGLSIDYIHALNPNYNLKVTQSNLAGLVAFTPVAADDTLSSRQSDQLKIKPGGEWNTRMRMVLFYHLWTPLYLCWRPIVFVLMLAGPLLLAKTRYVGLALVGSLIVVYHMLVVCVLQMPIDRYVTETILVELVVAGPAGVEALRRLVRLAARIDVPSPVRAVG